MGGGTYSLTVKSVFARGLLRADVAEIVRVGCWFRQGFYLGLRVVRLLMSLRLRLTSRRAHARILDPDLMDL